MNDDLEPPPAYQSDTTLQSGMMDQRDRIGSSNRSRAVSSQPVEQRSWMIFGRSRATSDRPLTCTGTESVNPCPYVYPLIEESQRSDSPPPAEIQIKQAWEPGLGVHTGFFKSLTKFSDVGGETPWQKATLSWDSQTLLLSQNRAQSRFTIKHAVVEIDKSFLKHPHTLSLHLVNGKMLKLSFSDTLKLQKWHLFLLSISKD